VAVSYARAFLVTVAGWELLAVAAVETLQSTRTDG